MFCYIGWANLVRYLMQRFQQLIPPSTGKLLVLLPPAIKPFHFRCYSYIFKDMIACTNCGEVIEGAAQWAAECQMIDRIRQVVLTSDILWSTASTHPIFYLGPHRYQFRLEINSATPFHVTYGKQVNRCESPTYVAGILIPGPW